ncbi:3-deoxy-D-manno-octulosonic acid kinase [Vibrio navarrensis]|uniref:3-deoxy-D-manno-octulosonic acid kinase n=1 Tax=Vibrio navarrensis TaxID=29495 RepID=UPI00186A1DDD|nr:3-deoxy-D-manno-octulosonic acid kinase [Vibrio navarrensis]MBE4609471.1 3-deoxy-D-manno-octulosonic acid kinase [Vibrio navarrensis]MBE4613046.1 3-deoxy-D-manno-octulosonic acid kinase [Vibrio navarrensis]
MIQRKQIGDTYICYDAEIVADPTLPLFDADYWQQNNLVQGSALGRGTTWFVQLGDRQAALRHYRRGGLFGKLVKDRYWFTSWDKTRSVAEFELLSQLRTAGVNVPRPIAARAVKKGPFYQADLLSERITNAQDLVALLQASHLGAERYHQIGIEIAKMHQVGVNHTDLNIHNILLDDQQKVWIIDFDKCFAQPGEAWKQANLARLLRSFNKELVKRNIHWQRDDFQALLQGYQSVR